MAKEIKLYNEVTGEIINGYTGYSWTTLFFGILPPLFRKDFVTFLCLLVLFVVLSTFTGIGGIVLCIVWSFMYNPYYTKAKLNHGFRLDGTHEENLLAAQALGIRLNEHNCTTFADQLKKS